MAQNNYKTVHEKYRILQKWPKVKTSSVIDLDQIVGHDRWSFIIIVKCTRLMRKLTKLTDEVALTQGVMGLGWKPTNPEANSDRGLVILDQMIWLSNTHHIHMFIKFIYCQVIYCQVDYWYQNSPFFFFSNSEFCSPGASNLNEMDKILHPVSLYVRILNPFMWYSHHPVGCVWNG